MNADELIREAYRISQGWSKREMMARAIAARVIAGEDPGILVSTNVESSQAMLNRVMEILREHGFEPQTGEYEPVSGPKPPIVMAGPVQGHISGDPTYDTIRVLNDFDRL